MSWRLEQALHSFILQRMCFDEVAARILEAPMSPIRTLPIFDRTLVHGSHVRSFQIRPSTRSGWIASEEADERVILHREYSDWHRVERAVARFRRDVATLHREGWVDA